MAISSIKVVLGSILNPINDTRCEYFPDGMLVLKNSGGEYKIDYCGRNNSSKIPKNCELVEVIDLQSKLIIPTFFDMHFHWVQDDVRTMPKASLLKWLNDYTFPYEKKFANKSYAQQKAKFFFERLVKCGTLGGACYSSIHGNALEEAFKNVCGDFVIGNVLMTMNSPKYLSQTKSDALKLVKKYSVKYKTSYALTPRFAIATDPETMEESAKICKHHKCFVQTHLSETPQEIDFVLDLYKKHKGYEKVKTYTEIYQKAKILGPRTIMGHGIHLSNDELDLLAKTKTMIAHCPTSNAPVKQKGLGSGLFDFKKVEKKGIHWALGSDIGGGPFLSMLDVMRSFVEQNQKAGVKSATYKKALYRATLAGAECLKMEKNKGNLLMGKEANFIAIDLPRGPEIKNAEQLLEKVIKRASGNRSKYDDMVKDVFYKGLKLY